MLIKSQEGEGTNLGVGSLYPYDPCYIVKSNLRFDINNDELLETI